MNISAILNHDAESWSCRTAGPSRSGSLELLQYGDGSRALSDDSYFCSDRRISQAEVSPRTKGFISMCHSKSSMVNDAVNIPPVRSAAVSAAPYKSSERPISVSRSSSLSFRDPFSTPFSTPSQRSYQQTKLYQYPAMMATCTMEPSDISVRRKESQFCMS